MSTKKQPEKTEKEQSEVLEGEMCPFCHEKKLMLMDMKKNIPFFGTAYIFSMDCTGCGYHKADIEAETPQEPSKYTIELTSEDDMKIRVVKSSCANVRIPHIGDIMSGPSSNGYVTNVEGILNRMIKQLEIIRDNDEEEEESRKKAKNMIKKLHRVIWGQEKQKLIIEDPTGNSAIISDKAVKEKLKVVKKDSE
ncbi:MAG: ZPR1 zinc finger domain-containing protein [Candidatus Woesearchaeota archaeon]